MRACFPSSVATRPRHTLVARPQNTLVLQVLCVLANAKPSVVDHYSVLGVSPDADMKTIKKVFREQAIELHPDKVRSLKLIPGFCVIHHFFQVTLLEDKSIWLTLMRPRLLL